jgi:hypothetical protein
MQDDHWIWQNESEVTGPSERIMCRGPDAMRPGADPQSGSGRPFIFLPSGEVVWGDQIGHEWMLDKCFPKFEHMLEVLFPDDEYKSVAEQTSHSGQPFFERDTLRALMKNAGAVFGRLGSVEGFHVLALWPETKELESLLPVLVDALIAIGEINDNTRISIGSNVKYTVGFFQKRRSMNG